MFKKNLRAWAALAVTAGLVAMMGQTCIPRPTGGPDVSVTASPTSGTNSVDVTLTATVTGGAEPYTYAWTASPAATITGADTANATATVTATTTFTCTVTDDNGRTDSASVTVTVTRAITVTASAPGTALGGETVNLVALVENETGAVSFGWLLTASGTAGSVTLSNQNSQTATAVFSADAAGTFTFRVTATDSVSSDSDTVDIVVTPTGAGASTTFTNGTDNLTGTAGNDIFDGSLFYNIYTDTWVNTVNNSDVANGLDGEDEAGIELEEGTTVNPTLTSIETLNMTVTDNNGGGGGAVTFNASKTTGATAVNAVNCIDALNVTNLKAVPALGIYGSDQNVTLGWGASLDLSGAADEIDVVISDVTGGTVTIPDIEVANIESTGSDANVVATLTMADLAEMVVTGDQDLEITAAIASTAFDDLDASAMTGGITIIFPNADSNNISIVTGSGDDDITAGTAADTVTATLGAGDDRLELGDFTDGTDSADGGDGTDTIALTNAVATGVATALADLDNFEALELTDGINGDLNLSYFGSITQLVLTTAIAGNSTVACSSGTEIVVQASDAGASTFGVSIGGTATNDTLMLSLENGGKAFGGLTTLTGVESLTIDSTTGANTMKGITFAPSAGVAYASVTITGDEDLTLETVTKGTPISASAFTGNLSLTLAQAGTVTGGSGDDALTGSAAEDNISGGDGDDTITGAAGADAINGGAGDDTINGGDGDDSLTGGAGADTFEFEADAATNGDDTISDFTTDDALDLNTNAGFDQAIAATVADTSTAATAWDDLNVLVVTDADGSIDTAAEVAALFGAGAPFENPANGDAVAVIIKGNADTTVWFCVEGDADADFAAGECAKVATLVGFTGTLEDANVGG
ncbi:MAG TPA: hypothetical protein PLL20_19265 [Phycisphaerae bacterium]|nr:hypothetical protein [Phycisphaerae bacterium]